MADKSEDSAPDSGKPIRRGRGLRLSVDTPPGDEAPPPAPEQPIARRRGLRLSTQVEATAAAPERPDRQGPLREAGRPAPPAAPPAALAASLDAPARSDDRAPGTIPTIAMLPSERLQMGRGFISYRRMGEGPPLLLLHGWGASSRYWLSTLPALADVRSGYAIDLPGFGESPAFRGTTSIPRLAAAVLAFADTLGLAQFDLNGHSFGASVAVYLAANYPDRVRRLGLTAFGIWQAGLPRTLLSLVQRPVEFVAGLWQPWLGLAQPVLNLWRPWAIAALSVPPIPQVLTRWFLEHPPEDENLLHEGLADMLQMDVRAHVAAVSSVGTAEVLQALVAVQAPALVIGGRRDKVTPPDEMAAAAKMIPESRLVLLDRCGHVPMFEQPAAYHRELRTFLLGL